MQVPPASSAASAASIVAQATSKDRGSDAHATSADAAPQMSVEQSGAATADRDAQGQSDGWPGRRRPAARDENDLAPSAESPTDAHAPAATLPDEPPSQLDIVG